MNARQLSSVFSRVEVPRHDPNECWVWTGYLDRDGYGITPISGSTRYAHRFTYEMLIGDIPEGLTLDHLCRNRGCVNPSHLEPVTQIVNFLRAVPFRTHCKRGHEFTGDNLSIIESRRRPGGVVRICKACACDRQKSYLSRKPKENVS